MTGAEVAGGGCLVLSRGTPDPAPFRAITVVIDDTVKVSLRRRDRIEVPVAAGEHVVVAKLDWGASLPTQVEVQVGEQVPIRLSRASGPRTARALGELPFIVLASDRPLYPVDAIRFEASASVEAIDEALAQSARSARPDTASQSVWALGWFNLAVSVATIALNDPRWLAVALAALMVTGLILGIAIFLPASRQVNYAHASRYLAFIPAVGVVLASLYTKQRQRAYDLNNRLNDSA